MAEIINRLTKGKFTGGYDFGRMEGELTNNINTFPLPSRVFLPVERQLEKKITPISSGQKVKAGQIIAENEDSIIYSSVNGYIKGIENISNQDQTLSAVVIETEQAAAAEQKNNYIKLKKSSKNWEKLSVGELINLLHNSGITNTEKGDDPLPLSSSEKINHILINAVDDKPFVCSLPLLNLEIGINNLFTGLDILKKVFQNAIIHFVVNEKSDQLSVIQQKAKNYERLKLYSITPKYPFGNEKILISALLGNNVINFNNPDRTGNDIVNINLQTIFHVYEAVIKGKPLLEKTIGLAGPGWEKNIFIKTRLGTPIKDIADKYLKDDSRIIPDNILQNNAITNFAYPVTKNMNFLTAVKENKQRELFSFLRPGSKRISYSNTFLSSFNQAKRNCDTNLHGEESPCIFCNYCKQVCPVDIIPHLLDKYIKRNFVDKKLINYGIFKCIECKLCDFVCPSKIPLASNINEGKHILKNK